MTDILDLHRNIWRNKKILQKIYFEWYKKIVKDMKEGKTLEIGSGSGNFKEFKKDIITSDICKKPWIDKCFDAHNIPFKNQSLDNIVMIDVLHHLQSPMKFLKEAERVLVKGGKIIMVEPYPSFFSLQIYRKFHPEPFIMNENSEVPNQAFPYLIFYKNLGKFNKILGSKFIILKKEEFSFLLYPLSGGFEHRQLFPDKLFKFLQIFEIILKPFRKLLAFRCYIVLEKRYT